MNSTLELLNKAQDLIREPANWFQGSYAADQNSKVVDTYSDQACKFCTYGALARAWNDPDTVYTNQVSSYAHRYVTQAARLLDAEILGPAEFNDLKSHTEVMAMFDKAKELAANDIPTLPAH